ncbi:MAG: biotin transporter BioY [Thermoflexales bacterium]|nr:biotin transporter BioY [Thermoflexales bacterium]MDW8352370.1 biotin transporter BioY [Anaerolineae bacterium]
MTHTPYPTLARRLLPQVGMQYDLALIVAGSWLVALMSQLSIPLQPVPITGQTFGVLLVGAALGWRRGALALLLYLLQGIAGLPFFAGGTAGIARLFGPTGGYLIGFVFAAALTGWLSERGWDRRLPSTLLAMALGNAVIYLFGLPWLARTVGWEQAIALGLLPFIPGDILKALLAAFALPGAWRIVERNRPRDDASAHARR